jgi:hypothetical protein
MIRRSGRLALATAVLTLAATASAAAKIVIDQSVDGVKLGATEQSVRSRLGKPVYVRQCPVITVCSPVPGASPGTVSFVYGQGPRDMLQIEFIHGEVALMAAFSSAQRTAAGIGPGVSMKLVRQRYPQIAFHHFSPGQQPSGDYLTPTPKTTGDDFTMVIPEGGKVDWIEVGRWNTGGEFVCDFSICS